MHIVTMNSHLNLPIIGIDDETLSPGSFNLKLSEDGASMPAALTESLRQMNIERLNELVAVSGIYPEALAKHLKWTADDLEKATAELEAQFSQ